VANVIIIWGTDITPQKQIKIKMKQRKVALMGFRSVGKSSLAIQFVQGQFVDSYDPTIENTFNKTMKIKNEDFEVFVVDTAGQDEYSIFPNQYAVDIHGYVLVYSIDSAKSFEIIQVLYDKIVDLLGNPKVPVIIVGNKADLEEEREVKKEDGEKLAKELSAVFLETSAKDNLCVTDMFQNIVLQIEILSGNMKPEGNKSGCSLS